jgi:hypothetical protein
MRTLIRLGAPLTVALTLLGQLDPVPASAQRVQFVPKAGVYTGLGPLTENTEIEPGIAVGAAAELPLPMVQLALRVTADYVIDVDIVRRGTTAEHVGDVSLLTIVGGLVLRPLPAAVFARPYFLAGAGVKRYAMSLETTGGGDLSGVDENASRVTGHIGGGVDVRVGPVDLVLEVADYLSTFRAATGAKLQHDAFGQVGVRLTAF